VPDAPKGWLDGLAALLQANGRADALAVAAALAERLPGSYFERTTPAAAAADLAQLEALEGLPDDAVRMAVAPDPDPGAGMFRFRRYGRHGLELSSFLPVLESFGLIVVEAVPHRIEQVQPDEPHFHLDDFGLRAPGGWNLDPERDGPRLVEAVEAGWRGNAEVDSLNRLVICARLSWRDVSLLRAYRRYRRQADSTWSDRQLDDPLVAFPAVARALLGYFTAKLDPTSAQSDDAVAAARHAVLDAVAQVERLEQDQVLRGYLGLIDATLRTSYWCPAPSGQVGAITLKLDSARIPELPPPRPHVEAFVYSPRFEGLHLRAGPIARGGIRWSDRQDDLRTEVLGLLRAQVLKNAIIVPTGAKGGFVCKQLGASATPEQVRAEVKLCYEAFIRGLLDVTDNVVAGIVVAPSGVRATDGEDPYLVVAADRGTAALSDLANGISAEYRFWLGDAFASGGSHGYDHKAMGITARGAWLAVKQHFRQLGMDPEADPIRAAGVGDMSGDVFGNGMLQSKSMRLVAAFDHRDVFIDPDPDPEVAFAERERLARMPGSTWQDYNRSLISAGGGVWSRNAKQIPLTNAAQAALGVASSTLTPPEVISAILCAPVDLLWFGGIGTFVKGDNEADADVGDRADDRIRVNASVVRARVVAEGGNLAFTQRARIQYSRRGGKINTDFIDNAAGVATSDREVNLKILLALAIERGRMAAGQRDDLLAEVADDVAAEVLRQVGLSAAAVTRAVPASASDLDAHEALMVGLESAGHLDRKVEALPEAEEIAVRRSAGAGLTRPELAVLLAHAKSELAQALQASPLMRDPEMREAVEAYFPSIVTERFGDIVGDHRLYPQLAATAVGSEIVDRMGITWAHETADELGLSLADVAAAYWAARQVLTADRRWRQLESMATRTSADTQTVLDQALAAAVGGLARSYLGRRSIGVAQFVREDWPAVADLAATCKALAASGNLNDATPGTLDVEVLVQQGVDRSIAEEIGQLGLLAQVAEVAEVSRVLGRPIDQIVDALLAVDSTLGLTALEGRFDTIRPGGRWERWHLDSLRDDLKRLRREAVIKAIGQVRNDDVEASMSEMVGHWVATRSRGLARLDRLARQVDGRLPEALSLAALALKALSELVDQPA
jgi:glutamate dehydrogenase